MKRAVALVAVCSAAAAAWGAVVADAAAANAIVATEGQQLSAQMPFIDCTSTGVTISWGDGTPQTAGTYSGGQFYGTHTYAEEGAYTGTEYCSGTTRSATFTAQVGDAQLTATGQSLAATAGQSLSGTVASFSDADPSGTASDYTASVDWGDGSPASTGSVSTSAGGFSVSGSHTYSSAGSYTVTVTIRDVGGSQTSVRTTVSVAAPAPPPPAAPAGFNLPSGGVREGGVALFGATGPAGSSYSWTVHGPGVLGGGAGVTCGPGTSELQTSFSRAGTVAVTLQVTSASGAVSTITHDLVVAGGHTRIVRSPHVPLSQWFMCLRGPNDPVLGQLANGGPPPGCQDEYFDGLIDMVGCLTPVNDISGVPGPEQRVLECTGHMFHGICLPGGPKGLKLGRAAAAAHAIGGPPCRACGVAYDYVPPFVVSTQTVRVNGLDVSPGSGAAVVLDYNDGLLASSNADVSLLGGLLPVTQGVLRIPTFDTHGDIPLLDVNLTALESHNAALKALLDLGAPKLGGFQVGGELTIQLAAFKTKLGAKLTLPSSFTDLSGKTVTSSVSLTADNSHGLVLDDLMVNVPAADLGALEWDSLAFCYQQHVSEGFCQKQTGVNFGAAKGSSPSWNATGKVSILGVGIDAKPPPPTNGIVFVGGRFDSAGLTVTFPGTGIPLGSSGVSLQGIGASFGLNPTRFSGTVQLSAVNIVQVSGTLFAVFASPQQPYPFSGGEVGNGITLPTVTAQGFAIAAGGDASLQIPGTGIKLENVGSGYGMYVYPAFFAAGMNVHFDPFNGWLVLDGGISGAFDLSSGAFDVEGNVHISALHIIDAQGDAVVSSTGIGACGSVTINWFGLGSSSVAATVGYKWGGGIPGGIGLSVGSCDIGPYRATVQAAADAHGAQGGYTVNVPHGLPNEMIKVTGAGGAPDLSITGPGGISATTAHGTPAFIKPFAIYRVPQADTTYIAIIHPPAGRYRIAANPGSPAITQVLHADGITPSVTARVLRSHGRMRLVYRIRREPGQRVIFFERGRGVYRRIGQTSAAHGTLAFTPAPGRGGRRQILAQILENGAPVIARPGVPAAFAVAGFTARGPRPLARAGHLTARHLGTRVAIRFRGVRGTRRYAVTITLSSGQHLLYLIHTHSLTIPGVFGEISGTVVVRALGNDATTRNGPPATAHFAALRGR